MSGTASIGWNAWASAPAESCGLPVPYIVGDPDKLGLQSYDLLGEVLRDRLCQVCGLPIGEIAYGVTRDLKSFEGRVGAAGGWASLRRRAQLIEGRGRLRPSASAEELLGVGEGDGEFGVKGVGDSVEGGQAGRDAAAFESGDG